MGEGGPHCRESEWCQLEAVMHGAEPRHKTMQLAGHIRALRLGCRFQLASEAFVITFQAMAPAVSKGNQPHPILRSTCKDTERKPVMQAKSQDPTGRLRHNSK